MADKQQVKVTILNQTFSLVTSGDPNDTIQLANEIDDLMNGIALNSALFNTTRIAGAALAGVLLAAFGPAVCFVLNAVSYLPVVVGLGAMGATGAPTGDANAASAVERLREGLAYVRQSAEVRLPIVLAGLMAVFGMNFGVWAPLLARPAALRLLSRLAPTSQKTLLNSHRNGPRRPLAWQRYLNKRDLWQVVDPMRRDR